MTAPSAKNQVRKRALLGLTTLFLAAGVAYGAYWYLELRHYQNTDDAYVTGDIVPINPRVTGSVTAIMADNTDKVMAGQPLVKLDATDSQLALEQAETQLAETVRNTHKLMVDVGQLQANVQARQVALSQAMSDLTRFSALGRSDAISQQELQHAQDSVKQAQAELSAAQQQLLATQALVLNTPLAQQPAVQHAMQVVKQAWINLQRTTLVSPSNGYVAKRSVQLGSYVTPGTPLMAVIPLHSVWVDANFKETQLQNMRIGQPVTLESDFYGDDVVYHGTVEGLSAGTGSAFSLLPPQNATGNWIKVVQRLPVRIRLEPKELDQHPLRIGLSMTVTVNTLDRDGNELATSIKQDAHSSTDALHVDMAPIEQRIAAILQQNQG
ncbi:EmrA/EmrK family multidrug efflux transporter periplasmic adaptor subunit [Plesiomonas shigelloides]|uniref:EmrA/EmrK family multidrug efflux transporter periplasmic adaptor subunit n=1 Tax=Plesiomonas shigelloides TaxID=703 RepID=UPI0012622138|nr:EmrA/EmrK family multidrug efflux transporter periplasmic adaptor subunit [Plesiomonas shigelloides]KAB7654528.1 EmrA/EmrK family multidrug efflux transporter periplasmic adaptor subunit [Plesiomonas shigelloides]